MPLKFFSILQQINFLKIEVKFKIQSEYKKILFTYPNRNDAKLSQRTMFPQEYHPMRNEQGQLVFLDADTDIFHTTSKQQSSFS